MNTQKDLERNQYKIFYGSSYDRGCEHLLKMWPDVKREVPQAILEIAYGWQLFDQFYGGNPASMAWKTKMVEMMKQSGITDHGRLSQLQVVELMKKCSVWAYPTHFGEINCINAIKSQALGLEPIVINYAALKETVQFGRKIEGDIYDKETQEEYKKKLIEALRNPMSEDKRQEMMSWARKKYSWSVIADQWDKEFRGGGAL